MKKICVLLALALALYGMPALAAQGDAILGTSQEEALYFNYCFTVGDTLYLAAFNEVYTYRVGDAALKRYEFELPKLASGSYEVTSMPFADGDQVYAINLTSEYGDSVEFYGAQIAKVSLREDGTAAFGEAWDIDWSEMVGIYDDGSYPIIPEAVLGMDGSVYLRYYDDMGNHRVAAVDIKSGAFRSIDELDDAFTFLPYRDGCLLVELYNMEAGEDAQFVVYNPADGGMQTLGSIPVEDYSPLMGLAYDAATDTLYCTKAGELRKVDLENGAISEGITDMPLEAYGSAPGYILDGGYYAYCSSGVVVRNLDPDEKPQSRLKINDTFWNDAVTNAYYRFQNAHGDVSVVLSREYSESANLLENMMNHDSDVDIYIINTSSAEYSALYNRGYLMEFGDSEKAKALADSMYPVYRDGLSVNGQLAALPVSVGAWTLGINEKALAALGKKLEDVPDNWPDFLDFLASLYDDIAEHSKVHLFYSSCGVSEARYDLLTAILEDYQRYMNAEGQGIGYNSELLRGVLSKLEQLDLVALGCTPDEELEYTDDFEEYSEESMLLQTSTGCTIGNYYSEVTPMLMRMAPDAEPHMAVDITVAVINPYTQNPEAARAYIDELIDNLSVQLRYCVEPDLNEPIRGELNENSLKEARADLDNLKADYEKAAADEKQSMEQDIRDNEEMLTYMEGNLWDVSPAELAWYRAHADSIVIGSYNWLYSEDAGEALNLLDQYRDGQIGVDELLAGIDNKVQMMLMEGN